MIRQLFTISGTSPASASTAIVGSAVGGLLRFDAFTIDAALIGATGGTLDVYLQRRVATADEVAGGVWADWLHFPQLASGASAIKYAVACTDPPNVTVLAVGNGTDASAGTPALAVNTFTGAHPGDAIRAVCVAGASTSAGAALTIRITARRTYGRDG